MSEQSLLNKDKPQAKRLNRKLIMVLIALLAGIFLWFVSFNLSSDKVRAPASSGMKEIAKEDDDPLDTIIKLPGDYADKGVQDLIENLKGNVNEKQEKMIEGLSSKINQLQSTISQQQRSIDALKNTEKKPPIPKALPKSEPAVAFDKNAASSYMFFSGTNPVPEKTNTQNSASSKDALKTDAKDIGPRDPNMQGDKSNFLSGPGIDDVYNEHTLQYPVSPYILQAGAAIPAILQTQISSNLPGMITAVVNRDIYDSIKGAYLLIPKGSKLIGVYNAQVSYGQSQVQAIFTRLIRPDGSSILLPDQMQGTNAMGSAGFSDLVNNHWGSLVGAAFLTTLFNVPAIIATNQANQSNYDPGAYTPRPPSVGKSAQVALWESMGKGISGIGEKVSSNILGMQPQITIRSGYQFNVLVSKDLLLSPYKSSRYSSR